LTWRLSRLCVSLSLLTQPTNRAPINISINVQQNPLQEQVLLAFANALRGNTYLWTLYLPVRPSDRH